MINKTNKERRRSMKATPTRPSNRNQRQGVQELYMFSMWIDLTDAAVMVSHCWDFPAAIWRLSRICFELKYLRKCNFGTLSKRWIYDELVLVKERIWYDMINKTNKERRRSMNATPTRPGNKNQWQGAQEDHKHKVLHLDLKESLKVYFIQLVLYWVYHYLDSRKALSMYPEEILVLSFHQLFHHPVNFHDLFTWK
jgi:hypothetical protein